MQAAEPWVAPRSPDVSSSGIQTLPPDEPRQLLDGPTGFRVILSLAHPRRRCPVIAIEACSLAQSSDASGDLARSLVLFHVLDCQCNLY